MKPTNGRSLPTKHASMQAPCLGTLTRWPGVMLGRPRLTNPPRKWSMRVSAEKAATQPESGPVYLSDLIPFESKSSTGTLEIGKDPQDQEEKAEQIIIRATTALEAARAALNSTRERTPARPTSFTFSSNRQDIRSPSRSEADLDAQEATRALLNKALAGTETSGIDWAAEPEIDDDDYELPKGEGGGKAAPRWAESVIGPRDNGGLSWSPTPERAQDVAVAQQTEAVYAEPETSFSTLNFISQESQDLAKSRDAVLPPLQSVLELTNAFMMPERGGAPDMRPSTASNAGRPQENGVYNLPDGTQYERDSGEEFGPNGYWYRWTCLRGVSMSGKVEWEERWWEASDWAGYKEMGAEKSGCTASGEAWRETWREVISVDGDSGEPTVERSAHKWAHTETGDEWEEKWGEKYWSMGRANKYANKWGKEGINVWHERWGEDYDGSGGCLKWTDKWAERLLEGGGNEQWGDKWAEQFKDGKGHKNGETWSVDGGGHRYQRWWGEDHYGDGWVRRHGHSTTGEHWDGSERMDTYYNPIPHFDFRLAMGHSPKLRSLPVLPKGGDELGLGIDAL